MSSLIAQKVLFSPHRFAGSQLAVLMALAWHSNRFGQVVGPSTSEIGKLARLSDKRVIRVLKELVCSGAITKRSGSGRGHVNRYSLNLAIFNKSMRSVRYRGGITRVFQEAELDEAIELWNRQNRVDGEVFVVQESKGKIGKQVVLSSGEVLSKDAWRKRGNRALNAMAAREAAVAVAAVLEKMESAEMSAISQSGQTVSIGPSTRLPVATMDGRRSAADVTQTSREVHKDYSGGAITLRPSSSSLQHKSDTADWIKQNRDRLRGVFRS